MRYTEEEIEFIQALCRTHSWESIATLINNEMHEGERVRTKNGLRDLVRRNKISVSNDRFKTVQTQVHQIPDFEVKKPLPELQPVEELIKERIKKYDHKANSKNKFIEVNVNHDAPIGIAHFGDPHVDDDGTNLKMLFDHVRIVKETDGLFGGNIGDNTNNWVGRLQRLYGDQSTSAQEAWQLCEYFIKQIDWLYLIGGNHDAWSGSGDPLDWICGDSLYTKHGTRLRLNFPNGKKVLVQPRHQWRGQSMWNSTHSIARSAQMGADDHILVGGHTHVSGYQVVKNEKSGVISHCVQVASYKVFDKYAEEKGFDDKSIFTCPVTIINPFAKSEVELVQTCFDPKLGAEYLTFLRSKYV